jgi:hypothetical protein
MGRLKRFEEHQFIGTRDDMVVHDCENADDLATLEARIASEELIKRNLLQTFAPDALAEARNRGFHSS